MTAFHIGAIFALFNFTWSAFGVAIFLWWFTGSLGIGIGYHRLLTHRGFKAPKWVEYFLATCGSLALEGGPIAWVANHRRHHIYAEREGDPHSPRQGFWWSHMGWIVKGVSDHREVEANGRLVPDLANDAYLTWLSRWNYIPQFVLLAALSAVGGMGPNLWSIFA